MEVPTARPIWVASWNRVRKSAWDRSKCRSSTLRQNRPAASSCQFSTLRKSGEKAFLMEAAPNITVWKGFGTTSLACHSSFSAKVGGSSSLKTLQQKACTLRTGSALSVVWPTQSRA